MSEISIQPPQDENPNLPILPPLSDSQTPEWENRAQAWLSTLPKRRNVTTNKIEAWLDSNHSSLPEQIKSLPRSDLHARILAIHKLLRRPNQVQDEPPQPRFQRTDQWRPVYSWLESLDTNEVVKAKEIADWLSENPRVKDQLYSRHSRYHLMHYIQKCHLKILRRREKLKGAPLQGAPLLTAGIPMQVSNNRVTTPEVPLPCNFSSNVLKDNDVSLTRKKEAFLRFELLTDLQNQLIDLLSKQREANSFNESGKEEGNVKIIPGGASNSKEIESLSVAGQSMPVSPINLKSERKRKRSVDIMVTAWSNCEASAEAKEKSIWSGDLNSSSGQTSPVGISVFLKQYRRNIITCLQGREKGFSWPAATPCGGYAGRHQEKWTPFLQGWKSFERQFVGPAVELERRSYASWIPTWCAYTSSVAVVQPLGRIDQGVQKVLDVRFHPDGLAQLVCSSNEAPNELLLYNLLSGRGTELSGHNCQIQAVEYAVKGASIVSCGGNVLKVWDSTTGASLFTLGPQNDDQCSLGHTKKINALTVNQWQSCLVVTSGGEGDGKLLLWNALTGELAADININIRASEVLPSIDAMEFCNQNILVCGSDSAYGGPALVQLWDIEMPQTCQSFPANDSFITSLKINPACNTIITGAGDGTVGLFDIRTCGGISRLSVGSSYEVTSVSFSSCGTYFQASGTSNNTFIWDTRFMPMNHGQMPLEKPLPINDSRSMRPLHCLSHGKQMPTAEHTGQLPGHVDEGDQGVNDARWLHREPVLVTVSGDGSIAMWDVTLGQPCVRHLSSHTRCANTVAVAPNDEYLCSGGDDQKVVLYHNLRGRTHAKWRLTHPLSETD
ncbi:uncharacterized protein LOC143862640 isoform X3 [Tasmannia lanceolata]|uniref:uncharacterized protein LOC143862640 isoform X3 n=1 Tax=Tasmannia lanceolata TaxID=3420 RepID=UPI004062A604